MGSKTQPGNREQIGLPQMGGGCGPRGQKGSQVQGWLRRCARRPHSCTEVDATRGQARGRRRVAGCRVLDEGEGRVQAGARGAGVRSCPAELGRGWRTLPGMRGSGSGMIVVCSESHQVSWPAEGWRAEASGRQLLRERGGTWGWVGHRQGRRGLWPGNDTRLKAGRS